MFYFYKILQLLSWIVLYETTLERGQTNIAKALDMLRTEVFNTTADRRDVPNIGIFITDGEANQDEDKVSVNVCLSVFVFADFC